MGLTWDLCRWRLHGPQRCSSTRPRTRAGPAATCDTHRRTGTSGSGAGREARVAAGGGHSMGTPVGLCCQWERSRPEKGCCCAMMEEGADLQHTWHPWGGPTHLVRTAHAKRGVADDELPAPHQMAAFQHRAAQGGWEGTSADTPRPDTHRAHSDSIPDVNAALSAPPCSRRGGAAHRLQLHSGEGAQRKKVKLWTTLEK